MKLRPVMVYFVSDLVRADIVPALVKERLCLLSLPDALKIFMLQVSNNPGTTSGICIGSTSAPLYFHIHRLFV